MNGWLPLILPLLMSFGYIAVLSAERHNGMTGFLLIRSQNAKYCATKVTAELDIEYLECLQVEFFSSQRTLFSDL